MNRGAVVTLLFLTLAGCGTARRSEPLVGPAPLDAEQVRGERVFMEFCHQCHPGGDAGLALAINNKPLPGAAIKLQVRKGVGQMPAFAEDVIPDEALDPLVSYMAAIRKNR
ncbi:MAG TPA: cytochrome c [Polyangia bacterium]